MAVGTVRTTDFLVNTSFAANTVGAIGNDDAQDAAESATAIALSAAGVKTANYTAVVTDRGTVVPFNTASGTTAANATYTVPPNIFATGTMLGLLWVAGAAIQPAFAAGAGVTINTPSSLTPRVAGSIGWVWCYSGGSNIWYAMGDLL